MSNLSIEEIWRNMTTPGAGVSGEDVIRFQESGYSLQQAQQQRDYNIGQIKMREEYYKGPLEKGGFAATPTAPLTPSQSPFGFTAGGTTYYPGGKSVSTSTPTSGMGSSLSPSSAGFYGPISTPSSSMGFTAGGTTYYPGGGTTPPSPSNVMQPTSNLPKSYSTSEPQTAATQSFGTNVLGLYGATVREDISLKSSSFGKYYGLAKAGVKTELSVLGAGLGSVFWSPFQLYGEYGSSTTISEADLTARREYQKQNPVSGTFGKYFVENVKGKIAAQVKEKTEAYKEKKKEEIWANYNSELSSEDMIGLKSAMSKEGITTTTTSQSKSTPAGILTETKFEFTYPEQKIDTRSTATKMYEKYGWKEVGKTAIGLVGATAAEMFLFGSAFGTGAKAKAGFNLLKPTVISKVKTVATITAIGSIPPALGAYSGYKEEKTLGGAARGAIYGTAQTLGGFAGYGTASYLESQSNIKSAQAAQNKIIQGRKELNKIYAQREAMGGYDIKAKTTGKAFFSDVANVQQKKAIVNKLTNLGIYTDKTKAETVLGKMEITETTTVIEPPTKITLHTGTLGDIKKTVELPGGKVLQDIRRRVGVSYGGSKTILNEQGTSGFGISYVKGAGGKPIKMKLDIFKAPVESDIGQVERYSIWGSKLKKEGTFLGKSVKAYEIEEGGIKKIGSRTEIRRIPQSIELIPSSKTPTSETLNKMWETATPYERQLTKNLQAKSQPQRVNIFGTAETSKMKLKTSVSADVTGGAEVSKTLSVGESSIRMKQFEWNLPKPSKGWATEVSEGSQVQQQVLKQQSKSFPVVTRTDIINPSAEFPTIVGGRGQGASLFAGGRVGLFGMGFPITKGVVYPASQGKLSFGFDLASAKEEVSLKPGITGGAVFNPIKVSGTSRDFSYKFLTPFPVQKPKEDIFVSYAPRVRNLELSRGAMILQPAQELGLRPGLGLGTGLITRVTPRTLQTTKLITTEITAETSRTRTPGFGDSWFRNYQQPKYPKARIIGFPLFPPSTLHGTRKGRSQTRGMKTGYTPSFTAVATGRKGKMPKELIGNSFGPGVRPIISTGRISKPKLKLNGKQKLLKSRKRRIINRR